jgi:hypothetical protein
MTKRGVMTAVFAVSATAVIVTEVASVAAGASSDDLLSANRLRCSDAGGQISCDGLTSFATKEEKQWCGGL